MTAIHIDVQTATLTKMLLLSGLGFAVAMLLTPLYTTVAYKKEWWKKQRTEAWGGGAATVYQKLHAAKHRKNIPTMAGLIFLVATLLVTLVFNLNRGQTWLPLAGMVGAGIIGLLDDVMNIRSSGKGVAGMQAKLKFVLYSLVAIVGGLWFYRKLGVTSLYLPGIHHWHVGWWIVPIFWFVVIATANSVNISDGLDGLAGGLLGTSFTAYALIAAIEGKYALTAFCLTIVGALLSYTWFNIFPARFFMGDVGAFALGTALGIVAMQTDTVYVLPVIGAIYVIETGSVIINRTSKKFRHGKKVFPSTPIHHTFEAIGWPETKITMRFWILGQMAAVFGLILFLVGR
ncbi:MAG TPA: phospho-N-acetylmuramoyl-pentapeptide-transferase [Candidatus Saccharimonadales bacterium]